MALEDIVEQLARGPLRRKWRPALGNGVCLVVVDSRGAHWERSIVEQTVLVALEHCGIPYRVLDLARQDLQAETLGNAAVVLLAQNGLNGALSDKAARTIAQAVQGGVGLVNLDYDLRPCPGPLREIFGFERVDQNVHATDQVRICETGHFVTSLQEPGEFHQLNQMLSALKVGSWRNDVVVLAQGVLGKEQLIYSRHLVPHSALEPGHVPAVFATRWGQGRAIQFTINLRIWLNTVHGHARELGDLFWRSIVWAAKKPFAANLIPPLVCLSVDDCDGRHDFRYVEAAFEQGFVSLPTVNIRNVPERLQPVIRNMVQSGHALCNTHALDYYDLLSFNYGRGERTDEELDARFSEHDAFWKQVGVRPSETVRGHWGEYGVKALPYFKRRGMRYFNPVLAMGLLKMDQPGAARYRPYGVVNRMYDVLPDDPELFGVQSMGARGQEDFLTGCTQLLGESPTNDVEKAARSAARCVNHGLRSAFFGEIVTHEQKFDVLSVDAWSRILARTGQLIQNYEPILANHDEISHIVKSKDSTSIAEAAVSGNSLRLRLAGRADWPLPLSVFHNEDDGVRREYRTLEPFEDQAELA